MAIIMIIVHYVIRVNFIKQIVLENVILLWSDKLMISFNYIEVESVIFLKVLRCCSAALTMTTLLSKHQCSRHSYKRHANAGPHGATGSSRRALACVETGEVVFVGCLTTHNILSDVSS